MGVKSYKELNIWKKGVEIVNTIYEITKSFPRDEIYGLTAQMRRCAVSIPSNIAEGFVRQHNREYKQFLYIALGSCAELETQCIVSYEQRYIRKDTRDALLEEIDHESRMLMNMIKSVTDYERRTTSDKSRIM
jgi:four helix bundle protein